MDVQKRIRLIQLLQRNHNASEVEVMGDFIIAKQWINGRLRTQMIDARAPFAKVLEFLTT